MRLETRARSFVGALRAFDSHERGILLQWATGVNFALGDDFTTLLQSELGCQIPRDAFVAMDYTLDWLYAVARCTIDSTVWTELQQKPDPLHLRASQEDVDLVIGWEDSTRHLILVEAKGFTGWSNAQLQSKARRLEAIFKDPALEALDLHFVLVGPRVSAGLKTEGWPSWMLKEGRSRFIEIADPGHRYSVQRCDSHGKPLSVGWTHWRVNPRRW